MEQLISFFTVGFWISVALTVIGLGLAVLSYRKYNIRKIYMIRSGKERRKKLADMEEQNQRTGKLRDDLDLDFSTGNLRKDREKHSGRTEAFRTEIPVEMPKAQKAAVEESQRRAESRETGVLAPAVETAVLMTEDTANDAGITEETAVQTTVEQAVVPTASIPFEIIRRELIIHTDETIEIVIA